MALTRQIVPSFHWLEKTCETPPETVRDFVRAY